MKILRYCAISICMLTAMTACKQDNFVSNANQGKTQPTIKIRSLNEQIHNFTFTLTASSDAAYYGYVVMEGGNNIAPSAYELATSGYNGTMLSKQLYTLSEMSNPQVKIQCTYSEDYQVFAAGMSAGGRLSKVDTLNIHIANASPSITVKEGFYDVMAGKYNNVKNPRAGEPFTMMIRHWKNNRSMFVAYANWFNFLNTEDAFGPYLLGKVDVERKELVFDGSIVNSTEDLYKVEKAFGTSFMDYNSEEKLAFWGSGKGSDKIVCQLSEQGYLLNISALSCRIHKKSDGTFVDFFDALPDGTLLSFKKPLKAAGDR